MDAADGDEVPDSLWKRPTRMRVRRERDQQALREADRVQPVNVAIVGVQKAATSTLFRMLAEHPEIVGGKGKEMRFFLDEGHDWDDPDYSDYARPARTRRIRWAMDATPAYFFWPAALQRMRRYDPAMRLLLLVRDPLERAFSQWAMERQRDPEFPDLRDAVAEYGDADLPDPAETNYPATALRRTSLFARGLYGAQLQRGLTLFPRDQWLVLDFRGFLAEPATTMDRITDFLGAKRFRTQPVLRHNMSTQADNTGAAPGVPEVTRLAERYRDDLALFSELSGLDVGHWPTAQALAGELPMEELTSRVLAKVGLRAG